MANYLITGARNNTPHVTSADDASFNAGIVGNGTFILNRGEKLRAEVITNNLVRIMDGDLVAQGRHIRIETSTYVDMTIDNGTVDMKRNDLICARYEKDISTGVESVDFVVVKGEESAGEPADPVYAEGDIFVGDLVAEFPIYRVPIDGLTIGTPVLLADNGAALNFLENAKVKIVRIAPGASLEFSAQAATAVVWNTAATALVVGFRSGVNSRIYAGSGAGNISTSASGTTYSITNNSSAYLRGFIVIDSAEV